MSKKTFAIVLVIIGAITGVAPFAASKPAAAAAESAIYSFCSRANCHDGSHPYYGDLIADAEGNLYGTTQLGGKHGSGVVFQLSPTRKGWKETVLHHFCSRAGCVDGGQPVSGVIMDGAGNLYGTAPAGGRHNAGVVFQLSRTATGWRETVLHHFCSKAGCTDGSQPFDEHYPTITSGLIIDAAGNLYGTASTGGNYSAGVVFRLSRGGLGWKHAVLHHFHYGSEGDFSDGAAPLSRLAMDGGGNLYGTTSAGGDGGGRHAGTVYRLSPTGTGWQETVLHHFCSESAVRPPPLDPIPCADGANPVAGVIIDAAGNLYGTAPGGGANGAGGVAYRLSPNGSGYAFNNLYTFCSEADCADGREPSAGLVRDASGTLFGTATNGGNSGAGVVFSLSPSASGYTHSVLHSFCADCTDGANPYAGVVLDAAGNLFGTTRAGGTPLTAGYGGVVFQIKP
jgi:uncharacterized repeat protein (TIGR03803 family)